jgi:hypothetical protein
VGKYDKIIFLDIDGVLNHELFYREKSQDERYEEVGLPQCNIDKTRVEMLNGLIKDTSAKVVISSTWRKGRDVEYLQSILNDAGFIGEVIGKTPSIYVDGYRILRGVEIYNWMDKNAKIIGGTPKYVIFDDDSDMLYWQRENFLLVDAYCGLTPNLCYRAKYILNGSY